MTSEVGVSHAGGWMFVCLKLRRTVWPEGGIWNQEHM